MVKAVLTKSEDCTRHLDVEVSPEEVAGRLEEIYKSFDRKDYEVRQFYWTIRGMGAKPAFELRKLIRQEVGMERLQ